MIILIITRIFFIITRDFGESWKKPTRNFVRRFLVSRNARIEKKFTIRQHLVKAENQLTKFRVVFSRNSPKFSVIMKKFRVIIKIITHNFWFYKLCVIIFIITRNFFIITRNIGELWKFWNICMVKENIFVTVPTLNDGHMFHFRW